MKIPTRNSFQKTHVLIRSTSDQYAHSIYYGAFIKKEKKKWTLAFSFTKAVILGRIFHLFKWTLKRALWNEKPHVNIGRLLKLCTLRKNSLKFTYSFLKWGICVEKHVTSAYQKCPPTTKVVFSACCCKIRKRNHLSYSDVMMDIPTELFRQSKLISL